MLSPAALLLCLSTVLVPGLSGFGNAAVSPSATVKSGEDLITRVLGEKIAAAFTVCFFEVGEGGNDTFDLSIPAPGHVRICGNNAVAIGRGLYHYLRVVCNSSVTWGRRGSGDNLNISLPLPGSTSFHVRKSSSVKWRYYMNVCTVSYSMVWWDWKRWEREIDWMALHGINFPLAFTGQEYVLAEFYKSLGMTEDDMQAYFTGPAFLAWNRMGNLRHWGGPLLPAFRKQQYELQLVLLKRMREMGMTPILAGFSGHMPGAITRLYPGIKTRQSSDWARFSGNYSGVYAVSPTDPHFHPLAEKYYKIQTELMGTDHYYNVDNFNEMTPPTSDPSFLGNASLAVYNGMKAVDPEAVWVMQAWLFIDNFWVPQNVKVYLDPIPNTNMILLDLYSEGAPFWSTYDSFYGKPFIWCMLHNFGGRRDLHGNLSHIAVAPYNALNTQGSTMAGIGLTPEAIEQNPVIYELMTDTAWHDTPIDLIPWLEAYVQRRYGADFGDSSGHIMAAWRVLERSVYRLYWPDRFLGDMHLAPGFSILSSSSGVTDSSRSALHRGPDVPGMVGRNVPANNPGAYNCSAVTDAWRKMLTGTFSMHSRRAAGRPIPGPLSYDLVDVGRQVLVDLHVDLVALTRHAYQRWELTGQNTTLAVEELGIATVDIIHDIDRLLATDQNYLLGPWIETAMALGATDEERRILELDAKNQITLWGPTGQITDYAEKHWSGLVSTYYGHRWAMWVEALVKGVKTGQHASPSTFNTDLLAFEQEWYKSTTAFPTEPKGDVVTVSAELHVKWAEVPESTQYQRFADTSVYVIDIAPPLMVSRNVEQLKLLCRWDLTCAGFTTDGLLHHSASANDHVAKAGVDLYVLLKR